MRFAGAGAIALLGGAACAGVRPAPDGAEPGYGVRVQNQTGGAVAVEYCAPTGGCSGLGALAAGAEARFALPASAAEERALNRVLIVGWAGLPDGRGRRQVASVPVFLAAGRSVPVALARAER